MNDVVFKRKYRWTISGELPEGKLAETFCKVVARPQLNVEEIEMKVPNARWWIPGKAEWEEITVIFYDVENAKLDDVWKFIGTHQDGQKPEKLATFKLNLYDGCGCPLEGWTLTDAYIVGADFHELDHTQTSPVDIELKIRYESAKYEAYCGPGATAVPPPSKNYGMGIGMLGGRKVTCPQCKHEFTDHTNIVF